MEKTRKWQFFLILAVAALTLYNILPTLFYYCKPLRAPIGEKEAKRIAASIEERVDKMEGEAQEWLTSFCQLIRVTPLSISADERNPQFISVSFAKKEEASRFRALLPRSGSLIPFAPAKLSLASQGREEKRVLVQRRLSIRLGEEKNIFSFAPKGSSAYRALAADRSAQIAYALAGPSETALYLHYLEQGNPPTSLLESLASQIHIISQIFDEKSSIGERIAARFTQGVFSKREGAVQALIAAFDQMRDTIKREKKERPELSQLENKILSAENFLKKHAAQFAKGQDPWRISQIEEFLASRDTLSFGAKSPLFSELSLDALNDRIFLKWHSDVAELRSNREKKEFFEQFIVDELARLTQLSNEHFTLDAEGVSVALTHLPSNSSFLALNLAKIASTQLQQLQLMLKEHWKPHHPDLQNLSIVDMEEYLHLPPEQQALSLLLYSPLSDSGALFPGLHSRSLYVIAKGIDRILQQYESSPDSDLARTFFSDFRDLSTLLQHNSFVGYRGASYPGALSLTRDFLFEKSDFYAPLLAATREEFAVSGTKKYAFLEFSDLEQRLLTENKIETRLHEDLLKWNDEYRAAQVSLDPRVRFDVPKPTRSLFWSNTALSARKFFRGDDRKILRWGLDLSGGKSVQIELRDQAGHLVKGEAELKQGINELYKRVNKMGVSEVSIRRMGNHLVLDFPGSQALSASELIRSATMYFHVVNEKFSSYNSSLAESSNRFLQEVWNEAIVTGHKEPEEINAIARKHLHGNSDSPSPQSEAAKVLWDHGLRLAPPEAPLSSTVDDSLCKIALFRGTEYGDWHGQSHPLLIVFRNYALEGAKLENIRSSYDPSQGNFLSFEVRSGPHRDDFYAWTSLFSKEKVFGTSNDYLKGRGWRMAVLLNDAVISAPPLESPLRENGVIRGSFSQREVNQLTADLKAGSLTFSPHILSEKNVSPELGKTDRLRGIAATVLALFLVIIAMIAYYRFAGAIASAAVLFNLLILWGTLQNLGAALTLAGLAGVILTVAMAVDANVLVFERIKEESAHSGGRIASAIYAGYKKAFSAIIDSNATTIIAALILLNFDAGPIKSFAINLIIGIASSLFTALFLTRYYFTSWAQRHPREKTLAMAHWIRAGNFDFLKRAKPAFVIGLALTIGGGYFLYAERGTILGMDFTGGYSLDVEVIPTGNEAARAERALVKAGLGKSDFQIRELHPSHSLRILLSNSLEERGKPFYGLAQLSREKNPRIEWLVQALQKENLFLSLETLPQLENHWTAMSGQMSETMRNQAALGLFFAFFCIFLYLAFRFESKFGIAALLCIFHDALITLGFVGLLHAIGVPIQIDLNTIAALMTIVGYSLNDTIIIFDRIREEMRLMHGKPFSEIVNRALNATLGRTVLTSGITLLVLIALIILGGPSLFSFSLVMAIGIVFGTLSSWFIASPLMLALHRREEAKEKTLIAQN